jgi:molybdopterin converting factor small subunit
LIEIHLYGKLRRFASQKEPTQDSIILYDSMNDDTIGSLITRLGIPLDELGTNIFLNGELSGLGRRIHEGDRLGIFPDDMQLLYRWYFERVESD